MANTQTVYVNISLESIPVSANILTGAAALEAINSYVSEMTRYTEQFLWTDEPVIEAPDYSVIGFYDIRNDECSAAITQKDAEPSPESYLFSENLIPFNPDVWVSHGYPSIRDIFSKEVCAAKKEASDMGKAPLFVIGSHSNGMIPAWDIMDSSLVMLKGYKVYRERFTFINILTGNSEEDGGRYHVYIPGDMFRVLTGIYASPHELTRRLAGEDWEKRAYYIPDVKIIELFDKYSLDKSAYIKGIELLNKSFRKDLKYPSLFISLEGSLQRYERLLLLGASKAIISKEDAILRKILREIG